ncbi:2-dehydro-3-deoxygluconokinase [Pontibacillus halophilus JSM 076056 = DSM 19796]|uniref:2-dehydro-3-deoxygluconokinase n=1 Tax=Pontibacillus halophilus JSM 076056 = DSM 19796 TaxID=1385510 RepID=A0A0A5GD99_9BACI|nr:sugar kinase [Pontibacillus halophilus]KGX89974.1 2-dehydro-3-deoxygluconokinase [Pontibacillus halophilus JSM 076056 = DSM 19796]
MSRIVTCGEVMMRYTPPEHQRLKEASSFHISIGGAEANVAVNLANLGHEVSLLTALPHHNLGENVRRFLRGHGVGVEAVVHREGRLGTYYMEEGFGLRNADVIYDRSFSSFSRLSGGEVDWNQVFEGCTLFHVSGITPALGEVSRELTLIALSEAKKRGILVSFDMNYRSKLWGVEEAAATYKEILPFVDRCFIGYKDFTLLFGMEGTSLFSEATLKSHYERFKDMYGIGEFACTNRVVQSANQHTLQGFFYRDGTMHKTAPVTMNVLDRVGGGDAFAAGVLHGLENGFHERKIVEFGLATSVLKHTVRGDHAPFSEEEVLRCLESGGVDVRR